MCLALPAKITHIDDSGEMATAALGDVSREISLALVEDVSVGDYVLIHVGFAISQLDEDEAHETLALLTEMGQVAEELGTAGSEDA